MRVWGKACFPGVICDLSVQGPLAKLSAETRDQDFEEHCSLKGKETLPSWLPSEETMGRNSGVNEVCVGKQH